MVEEKEKVLEPTVEAIIEKNLKHMEKTGVTNWRVFRGSPYGEGVNHVVCLICDRALNLEFPDQVSQHISSPGHKRKIMAIRAEEEEERLRSLKAESIEYKKSEFIQCLEDHPMFLNWQWIPLGSFVRVFKMDLANYGQTSQDFLITSDTDHEELIFEALEWLEK